MLYYAPLKETSTLAAFLAVNPLARVVKLVDTRDLKSLVRKDVPVRFRPRAPIRNPSYARPEFLLLIIKFTIVGITSKK